MKKSFVIPILASILLTGCAVGTQGNGSLEIYAGIRTTQVGPTAPGLKLESTVVTKIVDSLLDGKVTDAE